MKKCDSLLMIHSDAMDRLLSSTNETNRAYSSQTALLTLRHFTEHVMLKIYCDECNLDVGDEWKNMKHAINYVYKKNQYSFLRNFHKNHLQKTVSHKIASPEYTEALMILYYKPLIEIKNFLFTKYNLEVIKQINSFPLDLDNTFLNYYRNIQKVVLETHALENAEDGYYYIYKKKPIWVDKKLMYELTLGLANDYSDKQDRFVVFSKFDIFDNYSIQAYIVEKKIKYFNSLISVKIIVDYNVSIRTYELNNIGTILGIQEKIKKSQTEFRFVMQFIKENKVSLDKIATSSQDFFDDFSLRLKTYCGDETPILNILIKSREIIINKACGQNVLKYLLCNCRNVTIKKQISENPNPKISNLRLKNGVLPFEETPFSANLIASKQTLTSVFDCIEMDDTAESQLLANKISKISDNTGQLFIDCQTIYNGDNLDNLILKYNTLIPHYQKGRMIEKYSTNVFIKENEENSVQIIQKLMQKTTRGIPGYDKQAERWIKNNEGLIWGDEKNNVLSTAFKNSEVFILYGSAGTGKSSTISFILNILGNIKKLCLAPTHSAKDNMKRKINDHSAKYYTIKKFLSDENADKDWDIAVIDECSVVNNISMLKLLNTLNAKAILLTGDIHQLPSIDFGNWFHIAKSLLPSHAVAELKEQFRTNDDKLINLWKKVRNLDESIYEYLSNYEMVKTLDESIFDNIDSDQIILCYNYDGLYGLNSINRYLQEKNDNTPYYWNQFVFKVNDPIIFHNTKRFGGILYNNLKGRIEKISKDADGITFEVSIDASLNSMNLASVPLEYIRNLDNGWTVVRLKVYKYNDEEENGEPKELHTIPFQVAYAVSIHKSQGLEYNSVKVIIANNVEELITHNVFYTAITRAKKKLMIYWTPETATKVLTNFKFQFDGKDCSIIKNKYFNK